MKLREFASVLLVSCTTPAPEERVEVATVVTSVEVQREIVLGNVEFQLGKDWNDDEVIVLTNLIKRAYHRLSTELGSSVMNVQNYVSIPVYKGDISEARGSVSRKALTYVFDENLVPQYDPSVPPKGELTMTISELVEGNIAHELAHLFAQGAQFESDAFTEGMIYGYIHVLYPNYYPNAKGMYFDEVKHPCIAEMMNQGVDTSFFDAELGSGGVQDINLDKIRDSHWGIVWAKYIQENPQFIKSFFEFIQVERSKGKVYFSKEELLQVASQSSPNFSRWYETAGSSNKDIPAESRRIFVAETARDEFYIVNAHFVPRVREAGENSLAVVTYGFKSEKPVTIKIDHNGEIVEGGQFTLGSLNRVGVPGFSASGDSMWFQVGNTKLDLCVRP